MPREIERTHTRTHTGAHSAVSTVDPPYGEGRVQVRKPNVGIFKASIYIRVRTLQNCWQSFCFDTTSYEYEESFIIIF